MKINKKIRNYIEQELYDDMINPEEAAFLMGYYGEE